MMTRRKFLGLSALAFPAAIGVEACTEPTNLRVAHFPFRKDGRLRFVHFTDFHFKGDTDYASHLVRTINDLAPDFVCFTGDLVENKSFAPDALAFVRQIKAPVYGSPGNHDYWCGADFAIYEEAFAAIGGEWLVDRSVVLEKHDLEIVGMAMGGIHAFKPPLAQRRLLLLHYPGMSDSLGEVRFDLILSGHSHGGQVRLPFYGRVGRAVGRGQIRSRFLPNERRPALR